MKHDTRHPNIKGIMSEFGWYEWEKRGPSSCYTTKANEGWDICNYPGCYWLRKGNKYKKESEITNTIYKMKKQTVFADSRESVFP